MASKKRRQIVSYLSGAKSNRDLIPSLSKYSRRSTLTRWEKSAITRAENKIKQAGGRAILFPLTKSQARLLQNKKLIHGQGIRAIKLREAIPGTEISIERGQLKIRANGRIWRVEPLSAIDTIFKPGKDIRATIQFAGGRFRKTYVDQEDLEQLITEFENKYPEAQHRMIGIVWFEQKNNND